jgi:hypothetical protein
MRVYWRSPDSRHFFARLQEAAALLWRRCGALLPSSKKYRPELHYMRGPGPKYLKRHSSSVGDRELRT